MGRPIRNAIAVMAHTAFVGVRVRRFTAAHTRYKGTPPSRENDQSILRTDDRVRVNASLDMPCGVGSPRGPTQQ